MKKRLPGIASLALFAVAPPCPAQSGDYPNRPVKLVVAFPPGASFDIVTQRLAEKWAQALGQPVVVVESRPGAAGMIGIQAVARSAPDGYTQVTFNTDLAGIVPAQYKTPPYDPLKDFAHIGTLIRGTGVMLR